MSTLRSAPLLCLLPITLWAASAHAQDTDPIALYKEANTLYDAQKYPEAEAKYQASWDARKSFDTAGNLGNVELQVGQHREAAEHLGYALKNFPPSGTTEKRAFIEKRYAEALALVSTLDITTNPDGATIYLDDKPIGKTPLVDAVYVEPGGHTVSAKLVGHKDDTKTVEGVKGERQKIFFALTAAGDTTVPELPPKSRPVWPYVAFGGLAAAGLGVGITFMVLSSGKGSKREDKLAELGGGNPCGAGTPHVNECSEIADLTGDESTFRAVGISGLAAGGVGVIGFIAYAIASAGTSSPSPATSGSTATVRFVPSVGAGHASATWVGSF
ncbi:MAG: PEGA domain-containing protein [Polyangiaceae bacterium]